MSQIEKTSSFEYITGCFYCTDKLLAYTVKTTNNFVSLNILNLKNFELYDSISTNFHFIDEIKIDYLNRYLSYIGNDKQINIFDLYEKKYIYSVDSIFQQYERTSNIVYANAIAYIAINLGNKKVIVFDLENKKIKHTITLKNEPIDFKFTNKGDYLVIGEENETLNFFETKNFTLVKTFKIYSENFQDFNFIFSKDDKFIFLSFPSGISKRTPELDSYLEMRCVETYEKICKIEENQPINYLEISNNDLILANGTYFISIFDIKTKNKLYEIPQIDRYSISLFSNDSLFVENKFGLNKYNILN